MVGSSPIFLDGATGFVGGAVLRELLSRDCKINSLVHEKSIDDRPGVHSFTGGLFDEKALDQAMTGCSAAIHLVGIIAEKPSKNVTFERIHVEGTRQVLAAAQRNGVKRYIHMSALGTRDNASSDYHKTKWRAEQLVRNSGLDYTILRPSMIHGPNGEFSQMEAAWTRKKQAPWLFMPYFGKGLIGTGGSGKLQPVFVDDVARAFVDCLTNTQTIGQTYTLAGPEILTWPQMHQAFAQAIIGQARATLAIPAWYGKLLARALPRWAIPFNRDQVLMAEEDNTGDIQPFIRDLGWSPRPFASTLEQYAKSM